MRLRVRAIQLAGFALVAACAHRQTSQVDVDRLNRSIQALRAQNADYAKQVEELQNQVFILNDRLESRKVNEEKAEVPKLPTVTLHPDAPAAPVADSEPSAATVAGPEVDYVGDAAKEPAHRPLLLLHGDSTGVSISRDPSTRASALHVLREGGTRTNREDNREAVSLYRHSLDALRAGKHDEAIRGFREFLRLYPNHDLADNSQYWLGECFYDRKDYASAVREFRRVIERYPNGNKVPDAMLKVGYSYLALGSTEAGRQTLMQLQRSYPRHQAAVLAGTRLLELDHAASARAPSSLSAGPAVESARSPEEAP